MRFNVQTAIAVVAVAIGLVGAARPAGAQVAYDSGGFEPPRFVPGDLNGQDAANGTWRRDQFSEGTALVQSLVVQSGLQAVQLTRPADEFGDTRYAIPLTPRLTPTGAQSLVRVTWDMNVSQSPTQPFGPFFGVEGYDEPAANDIRLAGSLGVDSFTGEILYQDADGFLTPVETTPGQNLTVARGQWNRYMLEFDYAAQQYSAFLNGTRLVTTPFVDGGITGMTDAPLSTFATDPEALDTSTGTAYFDNYTIEVVPEPSVLGLVGIGSLALLRRRAARA